MLRATRRLLQVVVPPSAASSSAIPIAAGKRTTGLFGVSVHQDPLPALRDTCSKTLSLLSSSSAGIPNSSVFRQSVEASAKHKLSVIEAAKGDVAAVENQLGEGQIEEVLKAAMAELNLVDKMVEWKAWEPLQDKPPAGQWEQLKD